MLVQGMIPEAADFSDRIMLLDKIMRQNKNSAAGTVPI
jgi:hypothetical protein